MENRNGADAPYKGRDHHTEAFSMWMAGGGIKKGYSHGETDEMGYHGISGKVEAYDIQATILNQWVLIIKNLHIHFREDRSD